MQNKATIDLSRFENETLVAFATWKNGGVTPPNPMEYLVEVYVKQPMDSDMVQFNKDMVAIQAQATIEANLVDAAQKLVITIE